MTSATDETPETTKNGHVQAAVARTLTRGMALYFSRPVRLFRPSKVSAWHLLTTLARRDGTTLSARYVSNLFQTKGPMIITTHFIPPMMVNALLGTILWTTYGSSARFLKPYLKNEPIFLAALSGAMAGGVQALAAAPAENVRIVLESASFGSTWNHAWNEVFRSSLPRENKIQEARCLRIWAREVRSMAGSGWSGWGWGCTKDIFGTPPEALKGFAAFFAIFEVTRHTAMNTRRMVENIDLSHFSGSESPRNQLSRTAHGTVLVAGGVLAGLVYEYVTRPWDTTRRQWRHYQASDASINKKISALKFIIIKLRSDGISATVSDPSPPQSLNHTKTRQLFRTLARVGPWGVAFLIWEACGPGLAP
ncbi:hypothetical protein BD779DRAFT_1435056 [Infundibulicybe gibba]|nr:hypothetical protein BD779DRAFT_1435056 [Infundibulicybe gibba]